MYIVYGTTLYGRVDHVPGAFHVATKFAHVWYVPLIPLGSFVVLAEKQERFIGLPIRWSGKSILWAYLRAAVVAYGIFSTFIGILATGGFAAKGPFFPGVYAPLIAGVAAFVAARYSTVLTRPSRERALEIALEAGVDPLVVTAHFDMIEAQRAAAYALKLRSEEAKLVPRARVVSAPEPAPPVYRARPVVHSPPRGDEDMDQGPKLLT